MLPWSLKDARSDMANCTNVQSADRLACPKPQRLCKPASSSSSSSSAFRLWRSTFPAPDGSTEAGHEIMEIFLSKNSPVADSLMLSSYGGSPPYFAGSPPARAGNPLVKDSSFLHLTSSSPSPAASLSSLKASAGKKSMAMACSKAKTKTVRASSPSVRVEGFECTARDARRRVSTFA